MFRRAITRSTRTGSSLGAKCFDRAAQALLEPDLGLEAEQTARLAHVRQRVADIALARRKELLLGRLPEDPSDRLRELVYRRRAASRDVEDRAAHAVCLGGEEVRLDDVRHVREVARLPSVAVDRDRLPGGDRGDEPRDDS